MYTYMLHTTYHIYIHKYIHTLTFIYTMCIGHGDVSASAALRSQQRAMSAAGVRFIRGLPQRQPREVPYIHSYIHSYIHTQIIWLPYNFTETPCWNRNKSCKMLSTRPIKLARMPKTGTYIHTHTHTYIHTHTFIHTVHTDLHSIHYIHTYTYIHVHT